MKIVGALLLIMLFLFSGCNKKTKLPSLLEISPTSYSFAEYTEYIEGEVKNTSGHLFYDVQVEITLYDGRGRKIRTLIDKMDDNLHPHDTWKFRTYNPEVSCRSCSIKPQGHYLQGQNGEEPGIKKDPPVR